MTANEVRPRLAQGGIQKVPHSNPDQKYVTARDHDNLTSIEYAMACARLALFLLCAPSEANRKQSQFCYD